MGKSVFGRKEAIGMREELSEELCTIPLWFRGRLVAMIRAAIPRSQAETTVFKAIASPSKRIFAIGSG